MFFFTFWRVLDRMQIKSIFWPKVVVLPLPVLWCAPPKTTTFLTSPCSKIARFFNDATIKKVGSLRKKRVNLEIRPGLNLKDRVTRNKNRVRTETLAEIGFSDTKSRVINKRLDKVTQKKSLKNRVNNFKKNTAQSFKKVANLTCS